MERGIGGGQEKGPGSVQYWELQKAAEPVREMANRAMELLPETQAGQAFVREKLRVPNLGQLALGTTIRCKDIGRLRDDLMVELGGRGAGESADGAVGQVGESVSVEPGESADGAAVPEVVRLIDALRRQFAVVREYHERANVAVDYDFFVQQYDEMISKDVYPDLTFFNLWEERACRVYDDYDGVLTRITDCGHVAGIRFLSVMLGACGSVGHVKRVISYVNNSNCGLREHLLGAFAKWVRINAVVCGEAGCKALREFFDELVATSGGANASPWALYRAALEQNIKVAHENVRRERKGRGPHDRRDDKRRWKEAGRGGSPDRNDLKGGWGSRRIGDREPSKPVEVIIRGKGPIREI